MVQIRVSPERLKSAANELDRCRSNVDRNLSAAKKIVADLCGEWTGLAQVDYARAFNDEVNPLHHRLDEILGELGMELRRIAQVFEETDASVI